MKKIEGGITAPKGFQTAGVYAGIKKEQDKRDMAVIYSQSMCKIAGTFTTNLVKAAPVLWNQKIVEQSVGGHAIVINSGVANACTGKLGEEINYQLASATAKALGVDVETVMVASTGVIGKQLPVDIVTNGAKAVSKLLREGLGADIEAAEAIMTTDTHSKYIAYEFQVNGKTARIGGMCKGSGMIHPNMATMLGFITTDINISKELLTKALKNDIEDTFNMISVDGDTSTNDMILMMANGEAGNEEITSENKDYEEFAKVLREVNTFLSKSIAADGEGATKLFECKVIHAVDVQQARALSKSVITSNLTKTAVFGNDANWGRVFCAMGYAGVDMEPDKVDLYFESEAGKLLIVENGMATDYSEEKATEIMSAETLTIIADMKSGTASATAWGCDLSYDYVKINADYRS